MLYNLYHLF